MADTSERAANPSTPPLAAADLPLADSPRDQPYRPLSLLAVLGFALAVLYAFLVVLGGLVPVAVQNPRLFTLLLIASPLLGAQVALLRKQRRAGQIALSALVGLAVYLTVLGLGGLLAYSGTNPWLLLAGAGWLLAGAAIVVCWLARSRIAASEGTLGGGDLAGLGLSISLITGLVYGSYLASNTFAVRAQAKEIAERFIQQVADKDDPESLYKAFLLMLEPRSRPTADIRRAIEVEHNLTMSPRSQMSGPFTMFRNSQYVQLLRGGVDSISFERVGFSDPPERGSYLIGLIYRIEGPLGTQWLQVGVKSEDVMEGSRVRREWFIAHHKTNTEEFRPSEKVRKLQANAGLAQRIYSDWAERTKRGDVTTAYLFTLPSAERKRQSSATVLAAPGLLGVAGLPMAGAVGLSDNVREEFDNGLAAYRAGGMIDTETYDFFSTPDAPGSSTHRNEMIKEVKAIYSGVVPIPLEFEPAPSGSTFSPTEDNCFLFPLRLTTRPRSKENNGYLIEGELQVFCSDDGKEFRVGKLRLIRGQYAPLMQRPDEGLGGI